MGLLRAVVLSSPEALKSPTTWQARVWHLVGMRVWPDWLLWVQTETTQQRPAQLFSSQHLVGLWAFRVIVECANGGNREPIQIFDANCRGGRDTQAWGSVRYYQACMYNISYWAADQSRGNPLPSDEQVRTIDALMVYCANLAKEQGSKPREVRLLVRPLTVPRGIEGDVRPWNGSPWITFRIYDPILEEFCWIKRPDWTEPFSDPFDRAKPKRIATLPVRTLSASRETPTR
jgi:hypothetical protein